MTQRRIREVMINDAAFIELLASYEAALDAAHLTELRAKVQELKGWFRTH